MSIKKLNALIQATVKHGPCLMQVDAPVGTWEALTTEQLRAGKAPALLLAVQPLNGSDKMNRIKEVK